MWKTRFYDLIQMQQLVNSDPASPTYWLNWRSLLCAICVIISMLVGSYLIWKYETRSYIESDDERSMIESSQYLRYEEAWRPCVKEIHPIFLTLFRIIAFCLLSVAIGFDVAVHGAELFYYYTQWTFTLSAIHFGLGSLISVNGCFHFHKINRSIEFYSRIDTENGLYKPLSFGGKENGVDTSVKLENQRKCHALLTSGFWGHIFQILFQMTAGAVTLTDAIYWGVIFPFLTIRDYEMSFLTVLAHSLAGVLLLCETALNSLQFPWFRISYFLWWTGVYVIFQWIVHAFVLIWWPYPFLDLSMPNAPLWYLVVALMHLPCYGIFVYIVKLKHWFISKWFSHSLYICPQDYFTIPRD